MAEEYTQYLGWLDRGYKPGAAYDVSLKQMGDFNTFQLGPTSFWDKKNGIDKFAMPDIAPRYAYSDDGLKSQLNIEAATDAADTLKEYGDSLFSVFDSYQGNFDYLGENATVSDSQLQSRLGDASSDYLANADLQQSEYERDMQRMGVNPNSARFAGFGTSNALHKAAGLSAIQNQTRDTAREESWNRNLDVSELGLDAAKGGADAVGSAASVYKIASDLFTDTKFKYDSLNESARQNDLNYGFKQDEMKLSAQNQAFGQGMQRWESGKLKTVTNAGTPFSRTDHNFAG